MENQAHEHTLTQDEQLMHAFVKVCIDIIADYFPKAILRPDWLSELSNKLEKWNNPFLKQLFIPCVLGYPYGLDTLRKLSSNVLKSALDIVKDDKEYYTLTYFAIGKVYLYYGFIEKAYDYFIKFLDLIAEDRDLAKKHVDILRYLALINELIGYGNFDELNERLYNVIKKFKDIINEKKEKIDRGEEVPNRMINVQGNKLAVILDILFSFFDDKVDFNKAVKEILDNAAKGVDHSFLDEIDIFIKLTEDARKYREELEKEGLFKKSEMISKKIKTGENISDEEAEILRKIDLYTFQEDTIIFYAYFFSDLALLAPFFTPREALEVILLPVLAIYPYDSTLALMGAYHVVKFKKSGCIQYLAGAYYYFKKSFKKTIRHLENALELEFKMPYLYKLLIKAYILKKPAPNYLEKVFQYINEMVDVIVDVNDAYFILGAEIMCNANSKILRHSIAKIIKKLNTKDEKLLRVYKALKNIDNQISVIIRESTTFISEYEAI